LDYTFYSKDQKLCIPLQMLIGDEIFILDNLLLAFLEMHVLVELVSYNLLSLYLLLKQSVET
jgi:hypothetical protein